MRLSSPLLTILAAAFLVLLSAVTNGAVAVPHGKESDVVVKDFTPELKRDATELDSGDGEHTDGHGGWLGRK
ncbi:hypothetical protein DFJ73DRAFT_782414 [Zopfochytrium polystomum]|nr:hypothetical protein DFJ73DRAFT_782414 [Zopfochytrium polystomum]